MRRADPIARPRSNVGERSNSATAAEVGLRIVGDPLSVAHAVTALLFSATQSCKIVELDRRSARAFIDTSEFNQAATDLLLRTKITQFRHSKNSLLGDAELGARRAATRTCRWNPRIISAPNDTIGLSDEFLEMPDRLE